jgi:hypothetical protein
LIWFVSIWFELEKLSWKFQETLMFWWQESPAEFKFSGD